MLKFKIRGWLLVAKPSVDGILEKLNSRSGLVGWFDWIVDSGQSDCVERKCVYGEGESFSVVLDKHGIKVFNLRHQGWGNFSKDINIMF